MILDLLIRPKAIFNVRDKTHVETYKNYLETKSWTKGCPFILEFPYLTVPDMIKDKLIHKFLGLAK